MSTVQKTATKSETKDTVTGWFITRSSTGEILQHVNVSTTSNGVTFAGMEWGGAFAYRWRKAGANVCPFFNRKGAVDFAKSFELLTGEKVAVVTKSVA